MLFPKPLDESLSRRGDKRPADEWVEEEFLKVIQEVLGVRKVTPQRTTHLKIRDDKVVTAHEQVEGAVVPEAHSSPAVACREAMVLILRPLRQLFRVHMACKPPIM